MADVASSLVSPVHVRRPFINQVGQRLKMTVSRRLGSLGAPEADESGEEREYGRTQRQIKELNRPNYHRNLGTVSVPGLVQGERQAVEPVDGGFEQEETNRFPAHACGDDGVVIGS